MGMAAQVSDSYVDRTLFARAEHGGHPVRVLRDPDDDLRFEVAWPSGPALYMSGRGLLRALYGGQSPNLTVDQYFRLSHQVALTPTVFDLFSEKPLPDNVLPLRERLEVQRRVARPRAPRTEPQPTGITTLTMFAPRPLAVVTPVRRTFKPLPLVVATEQGLGIDIQARGHEVRKILFKGFSSTINRYGLDPDDTLQDIYKGLMARNAGRCPFDARKSSFGHYVHMVCACILSNLIRKKKRQDEHEQVGVFSPQSGDENYGHTVDAAVAARSDRHSGVQDHSPDEGVRTQKAVGSLLAIVGPEHAGLAERVIPLLMEGRSRADIVKIVGREQADQALSILKIAGTRFAASLG